MSRRKYLLLGIILVTGLTSCKQQSKVEEPDFNVFNFEKISDVTKDSIGLDLNHLTDILEKRYSHKYIVDSIVIDLENFDRGRRLHNLFCPKYFNVAHFTEKERRHHAVFLLRKLLANLCDSANDEPRMKEIKELIRQKSYQDFYVAAGILVFSDLYSLVTDLQSEGHLTRKELHHLLVLTYLVGEFNSVSYSRVSNYQISN
jgi:hypothetical protein